MRKINPKVIFTLTAGRTGSAWLADFLAQNYQATSIHEPLEIEDFGVRMPDIKVMRSFNNFGNNTTVQEFWERKLSVIQQNSYIETNHTLGKCGLIENLYKTPIAADTKIIILKRNIVKQCSSYLVRNDFVHITTAWQWYLHPSYQKKLVDPEPFLKFDGVGLALWYCYEMAARQAFYKLAYGSSIKMIEVSLEDIVTPKGANRLWQALGQFGTCTMPPRKNKNQIQASKSLVQHLEKITSSIQFDADEVAQQALNDGFSFENVSRAA